VALIEKKQATDNSLISGGCCVWVVIVSGGWKVASEITGAGCCYWAVEGEKQLSEYTFKTKLRHVHVTNLAVLKQQYYIFCVSLLYFFTFCYTHSIL
jgi:hypothetical protein